MNEIMKTIKNRRSIRKYLPDQIDGDELEMILEAAIYAPTGHNDQPWHFTVIQDMEFIDMMNIESKKTMAKSNVDWMSNMGKTENFHIFHNAPTVVIVSGKEDATSPLPDCCAAIENMLITAESIDIGSCWIGLARFFFETPDVKKLNLPDGYKPYYAVTLGYKTVNDNPVPERNKNVISYIK